MQVEPQPGSVCQGHVHLEGSRLALVTCYSVQLATAVHCVEADGSYDVKKHAQQTKVLSGTAAWLLNAALTGLQAVGSQTIEERQGGPSTACT